MEMNSWVSGVVVCRGSGGGGGEHVIQGTLPRKHSPSVDKR